MTRPGIEAGPNVTKRRSVTVASREGIAVERPEAMLRCNECNECNECNDALETERAALAMARRLALVAQNALLNGDLRRVGALLRDLCDVTCARLARAPARGSDRR